MKHLASRAWLALGLVAGLLSLGPAQRLIAVASPQTPAPLYLPLVLRNIGGPTLGGCAMFPQDNPWNADISGYPVRNDSASFIASINGHGNNNLHADFGENPNYGIPYVVVPGSQPFVPITFVAWPGESDPGPYPIPDNAPVEGGSGSTGDRHVLALDSGNCTIYELYRAFKNQSAAGWRADSGADWPLNTNALRPEGWTSADAAGLPILPGLVRYDEVTSGEIRHAVRFTVYCTQDGYIHPATHAAPHNVNECNNPPPMGLRLRLKASFNVSSYHGQALVILQALKKYGMINADNGTSWYISGAYDPGWNDTDLNQLKTVPGDQFEVVDTGPIITPP